ncbi:MAG: DUF1553 domain-containing protein [Rhizobiaceae bacterium]
MAAIIADKPIEIHRCDKATGKFAKPGWVFPELGQIDPEAPKNERLQQLADLLVHPDNGRTTRTMANRIWHRLMGRGIVHPVDAMDTRPWSEPLLDHLANELVDAGYDLKALMAKIAKSRVYQLASVAVADDADLVSESYRFAGPIARLMTAEQFIDNVEQLGGIQRTDDPSSRGRSYAAPGLPRSFLTSSESRKLSQAFKVYAPSAQVAADHVLEMRSEFSAAGDVDAVIHLGHWQGGTVQLNGDEIGKTGGVLRHPVRAGANRLLLTFPPDPGRVQEISGYVLAGQELLLDGSTAWESRTGDGPWTAMVRYHKGFPHHEPYRRDAEARRFATVSSLLQIRFPELTAARASLRENNLLMRSLGRPNREQVVSMRQERLTMLQAMDLSNGADFTQLISEVAGSYRGPTDMVRDVYLRALCRLPSEQELQVAAEILVTKTPGSKEDFFWSVLLLPEFQIIR